MRSKINLLNRNNFGGVAMTLIISFLLSHSYFHKDYLLYEIGTCPIPMHLNSFTSLRGYKILRFSNIVSQTSSAIYYTHNSLNRYISKVCNFKVNEACWPIYWNVYMKYVEITCMKNSKYLMAISKQFL